jgi:hypothetical protein
MLMVGQFARVKLARPHYSTKAIANASTSPLLDRPWSQRRRESSSLSELDNWTSHLRKNLRELT